MDDWIDDSFYWESAEAIFSKVVIYAIECWRVHNEREGDEQCTTLSGG